MTMDRDQAAAPATELNGAASRGNASAQPGSMSPTHPSPRQNPQPANGLGRSVELHIEELVLNGFNPNEGHGIGAALERELTRLFAEPKTQITTLQDVEIADLGGGAIELPAGSNAEVAGTRLAQVIHGGLTK